MTSEGMEVNSLEFAEYSKQNLETISYNLGELVLNKRSFSAEGIETYFAQINDFQSSDWFPVIIIRHLLV